MGTTEIKKCAICGKLFHSLGTNICAPCSQQADQDFLKVREYIYDKTENVSITDILQNTGVPEKIVLYLMREGRIAQKQIAETGKLKCAVCGTAITSGKLCLKCSAVWSAQNNKVSNGRGMRPGSNVGTLTTGSRMHRTNY